MVEAQAPQEAERVVARLRPNARRLFLPAILVIATVGALGYFYGNFTEAWINLVLLAGGAVIILLVGVLPLIGWLSRRYTITTRRIIVRHGFFVRIRQELLHSRGYDITVRKHGLQSVFGSGDVLINAGLDAPFVLADVPGPSLVVSALSDLMEHSQNTIATNRQKFEADSDHTIALGAR